MNDKTATSGIYTLGCRVNQYESQAIIEKLEESGIEVRGFEEKNDIYLINTCTVTAESDRKSRQIIRRAAQISPESYVIVVGCMAESGFKELMNLKGVDVICGNGAKLKAVDAVIELLHKGVKNKRPIILADSMLQRDSVFEPMSISNFSRTRAYVKIQDGCSGRCSYCIIPSVRGASRSRPADDVYSEVKKLCENGCREVVLTGIETSDYQYGLLELTAKINEIPELERIRFGSLDPSFMKPDVVRQLSSINKVMPHFHLSIQSGSDRILNLMRRRYSIQAVKASAEAIRNNFSDAMITTDLITGFPGETDADTEMTANLIKELRLLHSHIFTYSKRSGTPAAEMKDQIPPQTKKQRAEYLESIQSDVKSEILEAHVGKDYKVLFETYKKGILYGHSENFIEMSAESEKDLSGQIAVIKAEKAKNGILSGKIKEFNV
ncbi:MAG: tRNA (N(6)-L-threonylcarbamoyladenosine(37)-C(2))-methylthiotransferase MtaB [Eubacteriales bacterium]|jgi:threonylcarbamoyladenosine tRNA methylthiotransferase MtaB